MKKIIILLVIISIGQNLFAQGKQHFTTSGTIEFERRLNMFNVLKKQINKYNESYMQQMYDNYKKSNPQFKVQKSVLSFSKDKSLYVPVPDEPTTNNNYVWNAAPTVQQPNTVYNDLNTGMSVIQKKAFEEIFLLKDSTRKINWKITDETREIAGYTCRRANALIMDSIYVVAFYTIEIPVSSGPESFTGLPGMILGVAVPHDDYTWFATKVTDTTLPPNALNPPTKGKPVNNKELKLKLNEALKDWREEGASYMKVLMW
ncbi:GLPGLI family protein [Mucilaginibacter boryungensis]|uniref:GLPGLI family protein n=1 Tax=Mucilaginibacter boryungensis TaxID=768480 RepID=A0ABR9XD10_9SPHI|nr:GLPGLI family protein [Mucilaginibacter boryungensis]MBE9665288.1 GLPGLI family protein [Mucilaginibacter boryungensis]